MKKNLKFGDDYYLITQKTKNNTTVDTVKTTNHVFVVDVSGSMYHDLSLIRTQLKNKLSNVMRDGDTISIVWFSGKNEAGILKEEVEVKSLKTLSDLNNAIDKWLQPIGLTAFLKPLQLVGDLVGRIQNNRPDSSFSMIFLTDGYNNDCPWGDVITTLKSLEDNISSSTFVEYGYYADSQKLTEMASILGGEKISCGSFDEFEPMFNDKLSSGVNGGKKIVVEITDKYLYDFAFSVVDGSILLYNIVDNKILVGSNVDKIHFFSSIGVGVEDNGIYDKIEDSPDTSLYAAIYVLSDKLLNDDAERIFSVLGDNYYYKMLVNAFGKQKLNTFKSAIKECVFDSSKRYPNGFATIVPVPDDTYCFINLIGDLGDIDDCVFYPNHDDFSYNRIGKKKIKAATIITEAEKKKLADAKNIDEVLSITEELTKSKVDVKFNTTNPDKGYSLTDLVWNSTRANLSVRVRIDGEVSLPQNEFNIDKVTSFKYRTYTLVRDGIINVEKLPVSYSDELLTILDKNNVKFTLLGSKTPNENKVIVIDLTSIPLINRKMIKSISGDKLAKLEWDLIKLKGAKKVYDYYRNIVSPKTSKSFVELLGKEAADWLKSVGVTDYNGFAPKVVDAESTDFYMSIDLNTKIKGLSSLPKVVDVVKKIEGGEKLTLREWVLSDAINRYLSQLDSEIYKSLGDEQQKGVLKTYLETKSDIVNKQRRRCLQRIAEIKFALILSKKWFTEFKSFDDNQLTMVLDDQVLDFTFVLDEKQEKI